MMLFADNARNPHYAKDPAVVRFGGRYLMYYSVPPRPGIDPGWGTAAAESYDLLNWRYVKELEITSPAHPKGFCAPGARVIDGKVYLFYQRYGYERSDAVCLAVSDNGLDFTADPGNPVFQVPVSDWNCGRAIDADVIRFRDKYFLYAATRSADYTTQKLVAAVSDGGFSAGNWHLAYDGAVLEPELPWEQNCIEAPATLVHNDKLYLFYAGAYNNSPQQIGCAVSSDGIHFERIFREPLLPAGAPGSWNSSESGHPFAFTDDDGEQYLFFQGNNDNGKTWYLSVKKITWAGDTPQLTEMDN